MGTPDRVVNVGDVVSEEFIAEFARAEGSLEKSRESILAGIAGRQAGYYTIEGKEFRATTPLEQAKELQNTTPEDLIGTLNRASDRISKKQLRARKIGEGELMARLDSVGRTPRVRGSDKFKEWFGKGELVHPDGTPMVFFHGTKTEDIKAFDPKFTQGLVGEHGWLFFSSDPDLSLRMAAMQDTPAKSRQSVVKSEQSNFLKNEQLVNKYILIRGQKELESIREEAKETPDKRWSEELFEDAKTLERAIEDKSIEGVKNFDIDEQDAFSTYFEEKFGGVPVSEVSNYEDLNLSLIHISEPTRPY